MFGEENGEQHQPFDYHSFYNSEGTGHFHFNFDDIFKEFDGHDDDNFFSSFHGHDMFDDMFGGNMFEQHTSHSRGNHSDHTIKSHLLLFIGQHCETVTRRVGNTVTQQTTCY